MAKEAQPKATAKRTLTAVIAERLRERVISGTIPPGTQLNEVDLAERFSTSRGPVREAMQRLVQEGLLVSKPHRGVYVPQLDENDLADLQFARFALERTATDRILRKGASAGLIAKLEHLLSVMEVASAASDWHRVADADVAFHEAIIEDARSFQLSRMYASLAGQTRLSFSITMASYLRNAATHAGDHRNIAELLIDGDPQVQHALAVHLLDDLEQTGPSIAALAGLQQEALA